MKKQLLIFLLSAGAFSSKSQSLQLLQLSDSTPVANSYTVNLAVNAPQYVFEIIVRNISTNTISTKIRKTLLSNASGQDVYFCYGSTCYQPSTVVSNNAVSIGPGQQMPNSSGTSYGIRTEFDNNGVTGTSVVKYTAFDVANTSDTAVVYITYNVTAAGIEKYSSNLKVSNAYPNPAQNTITLSYNLDNSSNAVMKVYNTLGSLVKSVPVKSAETTIQLDVANFDDGVYFYTLYADGKSSATKKFVVSR